MITIRDGDDGCHGRWGSFGIIAPILLVIAACTPPAADPPPSGAFAFGVYGDGPYFFWENGRHRRLLADVTASDLEWLVHIGDILWTPCSDDAFLDRRARMDTLELPVVYTPGDNEWTDCHEDAPGGYDTLERLAALRRVFFDDPHTSLGGRPMPLLSQAATPDYPDFPENARWSRGGFVFATVHIVGSANGTLVFEGRTAAHDAEVLRRTEAAVAWLDGTFAAARADSATGVVIIAHGNVALETGGTWGEWGSEPYEPFVTALKRHVSGFPGPVLFIHGDSHEQRVDQPLRDSAGAVHPNFTRLETFGSPDIGWVRVVVDTIGGRFLEFEPRLMRGWF